MISFRKCPRCNGDILLDKDHFGWYIECLQCGYLQDLQAIHRSTIKTETESTHTDRELVTIS